MIINHEHRYVFVELPRTGSTTVGKELIETYGGKRILPKHSTYHDFLKICSPDEKSYFAFSSIRNPMDDAVSGYFKLRTDHNHRYSDEIRRRYQVGQRGADCVRRTGLDAKGRKPRRRKPSERRDNRRYDYIVRTDCDFARYFLHFYRLPYDTWSRITHGRMDFTIRFEDLEHDFERAMDQVGIELRRPLPVRNRTAEKGHDHLAYYTPETRDRAVRVFGPYMARWGYRFPDEWEVDGAPLSSRLLFDALSWPRRAYWLYLR